MFHLSQIILLIFFLGQPDKALAQRSIPDDNLAYPVQLYLDNKESGSGFYLNDGQRLFLVTAGHVLAERTDKGLRLLGKILHISSLSRDGNDKTLNILEMDLSVLVRESRIAFDSEHDVATIVVGFVGKTGADGGYSFTFINEVNIISQSNGGFVSVSIANTMPFDSVLVANDIYLFGYPSSLNLMQQIELERPLLRKGIIAGKNQSRKTIIIDCPVYPGNSGGPVLEVTEHGKQTFGWKTVFKVIGIVIEFIPFQEVWTVHNSDYSVVVPMDPILELTKSANLNFSP